MFRHKGGRYLFPRILSLPLAIIVLLTLPLSGQARRQDGGNTTRQQQGQNNGNRRGGFMGFDTLPVILRSIQDKPPASLVILDLKEVGWESQTRSLLQQDPLVVLNLNLLGLDASSGAGLELIQREGWTPDVPRWCLISSDGKVLYSNEQTPNSDLIMGAFTSAGLHTRLEILRRFLSLYPYHAEAKLALLGELRAVAEARTRSVLGVSGVRTNRGSAFGLGENSLDAATVQPQPELDMGVDSDIWGEYAREADDAFQAGLWKNDTTQLWGRRGGFGLGGGQRAELFRGGGTSLVSNFAQYSPMMKTIYRRWLPDIEYNLGKRPSSFHLWDLWLVVQRAAGGRDLGALQASLVPAPDDRAQEIPSQLIRSDWLRDCINRGDWRMAEDVARGAWEKLLSQTTEQMPSLFGRGPAGQRPNGRDRMAQGFDTGMLNGAAWNFVVEPYIEVLLRQMKTGAADAVVQQWFGQGGWTGAAQRASNMAKRLGLEDLGTRWEALAPPSIQPRNRTANIL